MELARDAALEMTRTYVPGLEPRFYASRLDSQDAIRESRLLTTGTYVNLGKIDPDEVGPDGLLEHDDFLDISTFYSTFDRFNESEVIPGAHRQVATGRMLWSPGSTVEDLRTPLHDLDSPMADFLVHGTAAGEVGEFGSLTKHDGVSTLAILSLFKCTAIDAMQKDVKYIIGGLHPKVYPSYQGLMGDAMVRLHSEGVVLPGIKGEQVPVAIDLGNAVERSLATQGGTVVQRIARRAVRGFFESALDRAHTHHYDLAG